MSVHLSQTGGWPKDKIPADIPAPENCNFVGDIIIITIEEGYAWYFDYVCHGIDEAAAEVYMGKLSHNGWIKDETMVFKDFQWKDKKYTATIEIYETRGNTTTFTCNFYIAE